MIKLSILYHKCIGEVIVMDVQNEFKPAQLESCLLASHVQTECSHIILVDVGHRADKQGKVLLV